MDPEATLNQLIDPKFSLKDVPYDTMVNLAGTVITSREINQKVLGRIAAEMVGQYGDKIMQKFATSIADQTGYKVSVSTLRSYRWVYQQVGSLDIPADFTYSVWKILAGSDNPEKWLHTAVDNGWNSSQLIREVKLASGHVIAPKTCKNCGATL